jgi:hypothetical protein
VCASLAVADYPTAVAFTPDGKALAAASLEDPARLWELPPDR